MQPAREVTQTQHWIIDLKAALPRLLLPAALILWAVALWQAELDIGPYGLIHSLPSLFFVSMILLNISFLVALRRGDNRTFWLAAHLVVLVGFVDLVPIILEGTPRFPYIFTSYGYADYVVREGYLNLGYTYHNWPGLHLLNAVLVQVTCIDPVFLLLWAPLALRAGMLLAFTLLISRMGEDWRENWMALWLMVLFQAGAGYLIPARFATVLMLVVLALALGRLMTRPTAGGRPVASRLVLVALLTALVTAHLLTSLATVMDLALLSGMALAMKRGQDAPPNTPVLALVLVLIWLFYVAVSLTLSLLPTMLGETLNLDATFGQVQRMAVSGSPEHTNVVLVRLGFALTLVALASLTILRNLLSDRGLKLSWALPAAWVIAAASLVLITAYHGEILGRVLDLAFFALVILAAKHVKGAFFYLLACAVLLAAVLYPINQWGNEQIDYVPPSEISANEFFHDHSPSSYTIVLRPLRIWGYRYVETLNSYGSYPWRFVVTGESIDTYWSFLGSHHEGALPLIEGEMTFGHIYDGASVQVSVEREGIE